MINFRKIASVLASTVMIGSTIALAAAAYPAPFVQGGNANVAEVYGSAPGAAVDLAAVVEINTKLQAELAKQTATSGTSTGASATGGDAVNVATGSQKIFANSALNLARSVLTKTELPTLLADGTAYDNSGTAYDYRQSIQLGSTALTFDKSGESIDPIPYLNIGTTTGNFYNYTLTLTKTLNVSSTAVVGNSELNILGNKFTVGASSDYNTLYLYGSGSEVIVSGGEEKKVTVDGVEHTIKLITTSTSTAGSIEVDGVRKSVTKGSSYKFAGGFEVYVKDVTHPTVAGDPRDMQLLLGAKTLHLEDGDTVRYGAEDTSVENTKASITGTTGLGITKLVIGEAAADSTGDYIKSGGAFTDRVFGNMKVQFAGLNPAVDSAARDTVTVTAGQLSASAKFTTLLSGKEYTLQYALDADNVADTVLNAVNTTNKEGGHIIVKEGSNLYKEDLVLVNSGDKGRILRVSSLPSNSSTNNKITFTDVVTAETFDFATGVTQSASNNIDGQTYYIAASNAEGTTDATRTVNITWGSSAASGTPGTEITLFPRIQLKNNEWFTILSSTSVDNTTKYALPGEFLLSNYETGAALAWITNGSATGYTTTPNSTVGVIKWTMSGLTGTNTTADLNGMLNATNSNACNFNSTMGPAILIYEQKTSASSDGNAICIPLTTEGTSPKTPAVGTPVFTDGVGVPKQLSTNTDKSQALDLFGTFMERDTTGENSVKVTVPADQMVADILFTATGATVAAGSSSSGTVKELGAPFVKDSEVSSVSTSNLIVIGGSCVNTVAAQLLGSSSPICGADFTAKTGVSAGEFLIQSFASPYSTGKVATLVAGFNAQDTINAAKYFTTQSVDTTAGKSYKGTSATEATLVTTTA